MFSQTTEYALRAFIYVAREAPQSIRLKEIAAAVDAPSRYLAKILGELTRAGYLVSTRGPAGGYALAPQDAPVTLASIAAVFEETTHHRCLLGSGVCGSNPDCPVHQRWAPIASSMSSFLSRTTVLELVTSRPTP
ncbi:MAG TPA: Rrf2 family transcriptional regulator [Gemmatimonadaceae bacterium]